MRTRWFGVFIALIAVSTACTSEATRPIDLGTTTTSPPVTARPDLPEDDPNAEARNQVIEAAKEECRKDPTREFGVVIIADADGVEVNRYEHPCDELDDSAGESETDTDGVDVSGEE